MNRPERRNALTVELKEALLAAVTGVAADRGVRAVVLTGAGAGFCVGQDLREHAAALQAGDGRAVRHRRAALQPDRPRRWPTMPKPVVAAINGSLRRRRAGLRAGLRPAGGRRGGQLRHRVRGHRADRGLRALGHAWRTPWAPPGPPSCCCSASRSPPSRPRQWGLVRAVVPAEQVLARRWSWPAPWPPARPWPTPRSSRRWRWARCPRWTRCWPPRARRRPGSAAPRTTSAPSRPSWPSGARPSGAT